MILFPSSPFDPYFFVFCASGLFPGGVSGSCHRELRPVTPGVLPPEGAKGSPGLQGHPREHSWGGEDGDVAETRGRWVIFYPLCAGWDRPVNNKNYQTWLCKWVKLTICEIYLSKAVKKGRPALQESLRRMHHRGIAEACRAFQIRYIQEVCVCAGVHVCF